MVLSGAQSNIYADDPVALGDFYASLGLTRGYRFPLEGDAHIVEVRIEGFTIGFLSRKAMDEIALLPAPKVGGAQGEIVLWCDDARAAHADAIAKGATHLTDCEVYNNRLIGGWVLDPEGNRLKFVSLLSQESA